MASSSAAGQLLAAGQFLLADRPRVAAQPAGPDVEGGACRSTSLLSWEIWSKLLVPLDKDGRIPL